MVLINGFSSEKSSREDDLVEEKDPKTYPKMTNRHQESLHLEN